MIIDARLDVDFGTDSSAGILIYFIVGCIFLPRALRGYRAGRREQPKARWYWRLDLVLCLVGLTMGVDFALSVIRNWLMFLFMNNIESPQATQWLQMMQILDFAIIIVSVIWIVMVVIFVYQGVKRRKQREAMAMPDNKSEE